MKRILALIISVALVAALVPAMPVFAATGWDDFYPSYNYVFKHTAFGSLSSLDPSAANHSIAAIEAFNAGENNVKVSDPWGFVLAYGYASVRIETEGFRYSSYLKKPGDVAAHGPDGGKVASYDPAVDSPLRFFILEIKVEKGGKFRPVVEAAGDENNSKVDVYLIKKKDGEAAPTSATNAGNLIRYCGEENRLGNIDLYNETVATIERPMAARNIEAGTYYLAFVLNGSNPNCIFNKNNTGYYPYQHISGFRLDGINTTSEPLDLEYVLTSSPNYINYEATALTDTSPKLMNWTNTASGDKNPETSRNTYDGAWKPSTSWSIYNLLATRWDYLKTDKTAPWMVVSSNAQGEDSHGINNMYIDANGLFANAKAGAGNLTTDGTLVNSTTQISTGKKAGDYFSKENFPFYTLKINIPYQGVYTLSAKGGKSPSGAVLKMYLVNAKNVKNDFIARTDYKAGTYIGEYSCYDSSLVGVKNDNDVVLDGYDYETVGTNVSVNEAGTYFLVVEYTANPDEHRWQNVDNQLYYLGRVSSLKLTKTGNVTNPEGEALDAEYRDALNVNTESYSFKDRAVESAEVSAVAADVEGNPIEAEIEKSENAAIGSEYTVTAKAKEGYTFLYWAMGLGRNKRVVSSDAEYTFKPTSGRTWLTAIYRANDADKTVVVFFNGNREEIGRGLYNAGDAITLPSYPSMAGFGTAIGWVRAGKEDKFSAGDTVTAEGAKMNFVAEYGEEITVSVTTNAEVSNASPKYGETVTATAPLRNDNADIFAYWEKDGKVVSFEREYSFKAWKNTTINAVYKKFAPVAEAVRKIILGNDGDLLMAEFILPEKNIIEKGVLFGESLDSFTHKVRMNGDGDYLSVINDISGTGVGYAILADGAVIYSK